MAYGAGVNIKLILKRGAYYDSSTMLCVCDHSRSYPVIASIPEDQRPGYCVQICGAPLQGVRACSFSFPDTVFHRLLCNFMYLI